MGAQHKRALFLFDVKRLWANWFGFNVVNLNQAS